MNRQPRPQGALAIDAEMARQHPDARATFTANHSMAVRIAASLKKTGKLLMLGMGASHAVARMVESLYREAGIEALSLPLSEQLGQPLPIAGRTILLASQSGESAEILRWLDENPACDSDVFGLTLAENSTLAAHAPSMIGAGGVETAFAATRSLTVTLAMHMAILDAMGVDVSEAQNVLQSPQAEPVSALVSAFDQVQSIVVSGRTLQGVAEALALGLTELSRLPCFALEGGQLRHGPMEMLGPNVGVVLFKAEDTTASLVDRMARSAAEAGSPVILFDASSAPLQHPSVTVLSAGAHSGLAAIFALLPLAQTFMVEFAVARVSDAGTPVRSSKITRSE